ncbi:MAG: hypothetical protein JWR54_3701 [Mucilaginibacter sp.]|nr:hypothetical protein [Mucilaginibacter sp.]
MQASEIFLEIKDQTNWIKVSPKQFTYADADLAWDSNWIDTEVTTAAGRFSANYQAQFMSVECRTFKERLEYLYNHLDSSAKFEGLESY